MTNGAPEAAFESLRGDSCCHRVHGACGAPSPPAAYAATRRHDAEKATGHVGTQRHVRGRPAARNINGSPSWQRRRLLAGFPAVKIGQIAGGRSPLAQAACDPRGPSLLHRAKARARPASGGPATGCFTMLYVVVVVSCRAFQRGRRILQLRPCFGAVHLAQRQHRVPEREIAAIDVRPSSRIDRRCRRRAVNRSSRRSRLPASRFRQRPTLHLPQQNSPGLPLRGSAAARTSHRIKPARRHAPARQSRSDPALGVASARARLPRRGCDVRMPTRCAHR